MNSAMNKSTFGRVKKRKTRKCLDELHKKSQVLNASTGTNPQNLNERPIKRSITATKVTNNRLTMKLGMFSKGVRSETVVRPQLSEEFKARMDENLYKIIDLANGKPTHTVTSGMYEQLRKSNGVELQGHGSNTSKDSHNEEVSILDNCIPRKINATMSPHKCTPCFTPPNQIMSNHNITIKSVCPSKSDSEKKIICIDTSSSSSTDSSVDVQLYEYFKNWIEDIPDYLSEHMPVLMEDDIYETTKKQLQRIYSENYQREPDSITEDSSCNSESNKNSVIERTMKESILLNPIEYIKKYGQPASAERLDCNHASTSGDISNRKRQSTYTTSPIPSKYSAVRYPRVAESRNSYSRCLSPEPEALTLPSSSDVSPRAEDHCSVSIIEGSPEITFYPRNLNQ